jgi:hypothetical protein
MLNNLNPCFSIASVALKCRPTFANEIVLPRVDSMMAFFVFRLRCLLCRKEGRKQRALGGHWKRATI